MQHSVHIKALSSLFEVGFYEIKSKGFPTFVLFSMFVSVFKFASKTHCFFEIQ